MSTIEHLLMSAKRILLMQEDMQRLNEGVKKLALHVADHEGRLIRIETTLEIAQRTPSRLILPGK